MHARCSSSLVPRLASLEGEGVGEALALDGVEGGGGVARGFL